MNGTYASKTPEVDYVEDVGAYRVVGVMVADEQRAVEIALEETGLARHAWTDTYLEGEGWMVTLEAHQ